ncbi:S9 family peptidase [Colwellia sp. RSH04]|uniref:alpha/beta hydrolase family protein n=1 Tax=Colwellia sp. RSH04 TaxID=2305464 RepID=UPI000E58FAA6|nr:prolyl oligopeptidase family serine peptidase [Colwellia sp. RSH04]RHW74635.1 S9 family peptidase [Colwellia sp. RSH04]
MNHQIFIWVRLLCASFTVLWLLPYHVVAFELSTQALNQDEEKQAKRPLLEDFYQRPSSHQVTLSPDGKKIVWIYALDNKSLRHLMVLDLKTYKTIKLLTAPNIILPVWHRSSESLFVVTDTSIVELSLSDIHKRTTIMKFDKSTNQTFEKYDSRLDAIYYSENDEKSHRIFRLGRLEKPILLLESVETIRNFYHYPQKGTLFYSLHFNDRIEIFAKEQGKTRSLRTCDMIKRCSLKGVDIKSGKLFINSNAQSRIDALASLDVETKKEYLLLADPKGISDREHTLIRNGKHIYTSFFGDFRQFYSPISSVQSALKQLTLLFPRKNLKLQLNEGMTRWLVEVTGGNMQLPSYYYYSPETNNLKNITQLVEQKSPKVAEHNLIEAMPLTYKARDGLSVQSYVWLPKNTALKSAPLVTFVHGGPWKRLKGEYDVITQLLVSNGYIVFQPNFRASRGFGVDFILAGAKTFGQGKTHNDIIDGIETLLDKGIGNRDKLGIFGHSFGGFSVLGALAFEPNYFKAGFATAPPAQMPSFNSEKTRKKMGRSKPKRGFDRVHQDRVFLIDDRDQAEVDRLYSISPDAHKMAIKAPLIIAAGAKDIKVPVSDVKSFSLALKLANKPVSLFIDKQANHSFHWEPTWLSLTYLMEHFFAEHLGGQVHKSNEKTYQKYILEMEAFSTKEVKQYFTLNKGL